jgi:hypothetical protein
MNISPSNVKYAMNMATLLNPVPKPKILRTKIPRKTNGKNPKGRNPMGKINRSHTKIKGKRSQIQKKRPLDLPKKESQVIITW